MTTAAGTQKQVFLTLEPAVLAELLAWQKAEGVSLAGLVAAMARWCVHERESFTICKEINGMACRPYLSVKTEDLSPTSKENTNVI